jgi:hypothetical protein
LSLGSTAEALRVAYRLQLSKVFHAVQLFRRAIYRPWLYMPRVALTSTPLHMLLKVAVLKRLYSMVANTLRDMVTEMFNARLTVVRTCSALVREEYVACSQWFALQVGSANSRIGEMMLIYGRRRRSESPLYHYPVAEGLSAVVSLRHLAAEVVTKISVRNWWLYSDRAHVDVVPEMWRECQLSHRMMMTFKEEYEYRAKGSVLGRAIKEISANACRIMLSHACPSCVTQLRRRKATPRFSAYHEMVDYWISFAYRHCPHLPGCDGYFCLTMKTLDIWHASVHPYTLSMY